MGPAIAAGNTLIVKPSEVCPVCPLYAQKLSALTVEAGFPPGVIGVLCGLGQQAGQAIAEHMSIRKPTFTGSSATGRRFYRLQQTVTLRRVCQVSLYGVLGDHFLRYG